jgi:dipeptidyl aminopeptidase/acylaminoacyl peptidase
MPKRPVALEDLFRFNIVGDTQISPDGRKVVFCVKRIDREKNKYFTSLWMASSGGPQGALSENARSFTSDGHGDSEPRWSPDGTQIAFVSDRDKPKSQIYLIPADGGEARPLTNLEEGAFQGLAWSPDGSRIAFLYRTTPPERRKDARKEREEKEQSSPVRLHMKLFYRLDGFGYFDDSYWQLQVVDVSTGESKVLLDEPHHPGAPCWSPDGKTLGFISNRKEDDDLKQQYDDIWAVPANGGPITQVQAPDGPKYGLAWSPDGRSLAYIGHLDPEDTWGGRNERVLVIPAGGSSEVRDLTGETDKAVGYLTLSDMHETGCGPQLIWSPDSRSIYCAISERGDTRLYRVALDASGGDEASGVSTALTPAGWEMGCFSMNSDGKRFGLLLGNATDVYDAYVGELQVGGLELRRLSSLNRELLTEVEMQKPEEIPVHGPDGSEVHAWMLKPAEFDASRKYPCVLYVHGGPALQYGGPAAPFHELSWLAANGYVVLFSNPRGSKGYGEAHTSSIKGDWGNKDWEDIQAVADYGAGLPFVDATRMAIMGGSYGGYMTAWAVGHTDRFACAITDRLVGNLHSMSGTCDFPWDHGKTYKGNAWDDPSDLWRVSPLHFAGCIKTPLLIVHSDGDLRCPISQAEELFAALRLQGKTVEFVRYPPESSHGLSRTGPPDLRVDRLQRNLAWLDRFLKT